MNAASAFTGRERLREQQRCPRKEQKRGLGFRVRVWGSGVWVEVKVFNGLGILDTYHLCLRAPCFQASHGIVSGIWQLGSAVPIIRHIKVDTRSLDCGSHCFKRLRIKARRVCGCVRNGEPAGKDKHLLWKLPCCLRSG